MPGRRSRANSDHIVIGSAGVFVVDAKRLIRPDADAAFELVVAIADGRLRDVPEIADRLQGWRAEPA